MTGDAGHAGELAASAIGLLTARGLTIGAAESLTGGLVTAALTAVPGASAVVRGGIVAYAAELKNALLGVDSGLLARVGAVHPDVALAMARGARERLGAAVGVATTGVAGPDPADGQPVGTVHIAVSTARRERHEALTLSGDRTGIRRETVDRVIRLLLTTLREDDADGRQRVITALRTSNTQRCPLPLCHAGQVRWRCRRPVSGRDCDDGPASSLAR